MVAKRRTDAPAEGSKRARADDDDVYEVELGGVTYVILEKLHAKFKKYFDKKKLRSAKALSNGIETFFVDRDDVKNRVFKTKDKYSSIQDYRLVHKRAIANVITAAEAGSLPRAPRVITDKDLRFFVDPETDTTYHVEMRRARTKEGIFFKAVDVGTVFDVTYFVKVVLDPRKSSFMDGRDYVWFAVHDPQPATAPPHSAMQKVAIGDISQQSDSDTSRQGQHHATPHSAQQKGVNNPDILLPAERDIFGQGPPSDSDTPRQGPRRVLYLTFSGLLHAIHVTRSSPVATKFREWVEKAVFAVTYGTKEQKEDFLTTLSRTDKVTWKIMSKITHQIMCIYLLETTKRDGNAKVYKFGKTEDFRLRFLDHMREYGESIRLEHLVLVPADKLYEAETTLKKSLMEHSKFRLNNKLEEVSLDTDELAVVRTIMQTISDRFLGQSLIISTRYDMLMLNKDREVAVLVEKLASAKQLLANIEKSHAEQLACINEVTSEKLGGAHDKLTSVKEAYANELATMEKTHADKFTDMQALHADKLADMQALHADKLASVKEVYADKLASVKEVYADKLVMLEQSHEETLKCAREKLASAQEKLASVEVMYQEKLMKFEEIAELRLQVVEMEKRALQVEVTNLKAQLKSSRQ